MNFRSQNLVANYCANTLTGLIKVFILLFLLSYSWRSACCLHDLFHDLLAQQGLAVGRIVRVIRDAVGARPATGRPAVGVNDV